MTNDEVAKELKTLIQYEIDRSFILDQAISNLDSPEVKNKLLSYKGETEENIRRLSDLTRGFGGAAPAYSRDFKGFFMQGYAAMRGLTGDGGILEALDTNMKFVLKAYENALKLSFPENVQPNIQDIYLKIKECGDCVNEQIKKLK